MSQTRNDQVMEIVRRRLQDVIDTRPRPSNTMPDYLQETRCNNVWIARIIGKNCNTELSSSSCATQLDALQDLFRKTQDVGHRGQRVLGHDNAARINQINPHLWQLANQPPLQPPFHPPQALVNVMGTGLGDSHVQQQEHHVGLQQQQHISPPPVQSRVLAPQDQRTAGFAAAQASSDHLSCQPIINPGTKVVPTDVQAGEARRGAVSQLGPGSSGVHNYGTMLNPVIINLTQYADEPQRQERQSQQEQHKQQQERVEQQLEHEERQRQPEEQQARSAPQQESRIKYNTIPAVNSPQWTPINKKRSQEPDVDISVSENKQAIGNAQAKLQKRQKHGLFPVSCMPPMGNGPTHMAPWLQSRQSASLNNFTGSGEPLVHMPGAPNERTSPVERLKRSEEAGATLAPEPTALVHASTEGHQRNVVESAGNGPRSRLSDDTITSPPSPRSTITPPLSLSTATSEVDTMTTSLKVNSDAQGDPSSDTASTNLMVCDPDDESLSDVPPSLPQGLEVNDTKGEEPLHPRQWERRNKPSGAEAEGPKINGSEEQDVLHARQWGPCNA